MLKIKITHEAVLHLGQIILPQCLLHRSDTLFSFGYAGLGEALFLHAVLHFVSELSVECDGEVLLILQGRTAVLYAVIDGLL